MQNDYRALNVTDLWTGTGDLIAVDIDGHVPARLALAAANRYAREVWGYLSLARESREDPFGFTHTVTCCRQIYLRHRVCLTKRCECAGYGHVDAFAIPRAGARPVTRLDITD